MNREEVLQWLEEVKDPEIPVLSLIDLGVITEVDVTGAKVRVEMTPTFVGCPAMDYMRNEVETVLKSHGVKEAEVNVSLKKSWSSDHITEKGKAALKAFGLAPPPGLKGLIQDIDILEHAVCPRCNGTNTVMRSPFGPTLCRSLHYCHDCHEAFEQFKPLGEAL
ncbi:MAG: phenylacetate-CoA oxygenase subunit PaaJ [Cyclobacteriaceae bacterium]|nr:phenylacetate-CoA oxygenase subunit PaaJ [Cyclobacteriaceae bacterium]